MACNSPPVLDQRRPAGTQHDEPGRSSGLTTGPPPDHSERRTHYAPEVEELLHQLHEATMEARRPVHSPAAEEATAVRLKAPRATGDEAHDSRRRGQTELELLQRQVFRPMVFAPVTPSPATSLSPIPFSGPRCTSATGDSRCAGRDDRSPMAVARRLQAVRMQVALVSSEHRRCIKDYVPTVSDAYRSDAALRREFDRGMRERTRRLRERGEQRFAVIQGNHRALLQDYESVEEARLQNRREAAEMRAAAAQSRHDQIIGDYYQKVTAAVRRYDDRTHAARAATPPQASRRGVALPALGRSTPKPKLPLSIACVESPSAQTDHLEL